MAGEKFNINSPNSWALFYLKSLGCLSLKKQKPVIPLLLMFWKNWNRVMKLLEKFFIYRQLGKLQSTYIEGLLKVVNPKTDKIHTIFNQTLTQTGRLSSMDPNLQNIPIRLEEGRKFVRRLFLQKRIGLFLPPIIRKLNCVFSLILPVMKDLFKHLKKEWIFIRKQLWMFSMLKQMK